MTLPRIYVLDSSVCIDLYWADLIKSVPTLPLRFILPDLIRVELFNPKEMSNAFKEFQVSQLSGNQISRLYLMSEDERYKGLTIGDLSAFVLAKDKGAILLTNDRHLRNLAVGEGLPCHGSLWVLDKLISSATITTMAAVTALNAMIEHGAWFPKSECESRTAKWKHFAQARSLIDIFTMGEGVENGSKGNQ